VRSLARGSPSSPRYEPYHDDSDDDVEASGSGLNRSSSSADEQFDVEGGGFVVPTTQQSRRTPQTADWYGILSDSLGSVTGVGMARRDAEERRNTEVRRDR
jgi:hypothetical protein